MASYSPSSASDILAHDANAHAANPNLRDEWLKPKGCTAIAGASIPTADNIVVFSPIHSVLGLDPVSRPQAFGNMQSLQP